MSAWQAAPVCWWKHRFVSGFFAALEQKNLEAVLADVPEHAQPGGKREKKRQPGKVAAGAYLEMTRGSSGAPREGDQKHVKACVDKFGSAPYLLSVFHRTVARSGNRLGLESNRHRAFSQK